MLSAGEKKYFKAYIDISTNVKSLDDTMKLAIYLATSEDKTSAFKFVVSEDVAIKILSKKADKEYFNSPLSEYFFITGDEINSSIKEKKFNTTELGLGTWNVLSLLKRQVEYMKMEMSMLLVI